MGRFCVDSLCKSLFLPKEYEGRTCEQSTCANSGDICSMVNELATDEVDRELFPRVPG